MVSLFYQKRRLDISNELKNEIATAANINRKLVLAESKKQQPWSQGSEKNHSIHILPLPTPVQCWQNTFIRHKFAFYRFPTLKGEMGVLTLIM